MAELLDAISSIFGYFINLIGDMVSLFSLGFRAAEYLFSVLVFVPTYFSAALLPFIALFVILMVLNRGA